MVGGGGPGRRGPPVLDPHRRRNTLVDPGHPLAALAGTGADLPLPATELAVTGVDTLAHQSRFQAVRRVPPGSLLIITRDNGAEPATHVAPTAFGRTRAPSSFDEGAADLRRALTEATSRRARHAEHVTCDLSGGLDSASLACLAAAHGPVDAVTFTDDRTTVEDDLRHACRVAAETPGITHHIVHGPTTAHFDHLDDLAALPRTDAPAATLTRLALTNARFTATAIGGSTTHLTGRGGDTILRSTPTHLIDLLRDGYYRVEALRRITAHARTHRLATHHAIADATKAAARTYPRALSLLANALENPDPRPRRPAPLRWCGTTAAAGWLTPDGRRAAATLVADRAHHACADTRAAELHDRLALERTGNRHATFTQIAHHRWATTVHAPFLDTTVVDAALAVPGPERERPGQSQPLLRAALTGRIPPWLPSRATNTAATANIHAGLRRNAPALRALIAGSALGRAGLVDPARMLGDLEKAVHGMPAPSTHLRDLVVAEVWLATLDDTRAGWWQDKDSGAHP
ncbi:asparagine synthase-related protein (plasmid) [Embleya sp. NBC_00888]|uniref:asparagine synthase-related protein n=1 Tax=Embleya sp. NBC_00888 TaxID=2975960 RepID=UPI003869FDEA|nr:asparagine synthase-related protein [Embleya sp. NBC_00888]